MPDSTRAVPVTIKLKPAGAVLNDVVECDWVGHVVSRMLQPASVDRRFEVIDAISTEARQRGLTDEILQAELETYNAERWEQPPSSRCRRNRVRRFHAR